MKKSSVLFAAVTLSLALSACSNGSSSASSKTSDSHEVTEKSSSKTTKASKIAVVKQDVEVLFSDSKMNKLDSSTEKSSIIAVDKEVKELPPSDNRKNLMADVARAKKLYNKRLENTTQKLETQDGTKITVVKEQNFRPNYTASWNGNLNINTVSVTKTKSFSYDDGDGSKDYNGLIQVNYTYKATSDVTLYDDQTVLSTSDGQQVDVDSEDSTIVGDINSGVTKKGTAIFFMPNSDYGQVTSVRLKIDAIPQSDDSADMHTFDMTVPLRTSTEIIR